MHAAAGAGPQNPPAGPPAQSYASLWLAGATGIWLLQAWELIALRLLPGTVSLPPLRALAVGLVGAGLWSATFGLLALPEALALRVGQRARRPGARPWRDARRARRASLAGLSLGLALGGVLLGLAADARLGTALALGLGGVCALLAQAAVLLLLPEPAQLAGPLRLPRALLPALILPALAALLLLGLRPGLRVDVASHGLFGRAALATLHEASDFDGDGVPGLFGGDCAPFDASRHPGAADPPGDGLDQDCNGQDASERAPPPAPSADGRLAGSNLVLVTLAGLSAERAAAPDRLLTPALELAASRGLLFERAYAASPLPATALASLLTSRLPDQLELVDARVWPDGRIELQAPDEDVPEGANPLPGAPLHDPWPNLAQVLAQHDYLTMAVASATELSPGGGLLRGFARVDAQALPEVLAGGVASDRAVDAAIQALDEARGRRFFLWLHLPDGDPPYRLHAGTPRFGERWSDRRDGELAFADAQLARLLGALELRGLLSHSVVALLGSHGSAPGTRPGPAALSEGALRVPLLFLLPEQRQGRFAPVVELSDLAPTVLDLLGLPRPASMQGQSLLPILDGLRDERARAEAVATLGRPGRGPRAIVAQDWKLVQHPALGAAQLFHLREDPRERRDRLSSEPRVAEFLLRRLAEWDRRGPPPR